jgi:predicted DNA-binding antitoxin AbrB/MazE fold protein
MSTRLGYNPFMTTITVQATYRSGVLQPATQLNLPEGATVEVKITPTTSASTAKPTGFGSLAGIWEHLSEADLDQMEQGLTALRQQTSERVENLARELKSNGP